MFRSDTRLLGSPLFTLILYLFSFSSSGSFLSPIPIVASPPLPPPPSSLIVAVCESPLTLSLLLLGNKYLLINAMLLCGLVGVALCRTGSDTSSFLGDTPTGVLTLMEFTLSLELEFELDEKLSVDKVGFRGLNTGFVIELLRFPPLPLVVCVDILLGNTGNGLLLE